MSDIETAVAAYLGMGGVAARNALTSETRLPVLRMLVASESRGIVKTKAEARIRAIEKESPPPSPEDPGAATPVRRKVAGEKVRTDRRKNLLPAETPKAEPAPMPEESHPTPAPAPERTETPKAEIVVDIGKALRSAEKARAERIFPKKARKAKPAPAPETPKARVDTSDNAPETPKAEATPPAEPAGLEDAETVIDDATPPVVHTGKRGSEWRIPAKEEMGKCSNPACDTYGLISEVIGYRHIVRNGERVQVRQPRCKKCRNEAARKAVARTRARQKRYGKK
jgi:hypothetical protein